MYVGPLDREHVRNKCPIVIKFYYISSQARCYDPLLAVYNLYITLAAFMLTPSAAACCLRSRYLI